MPTKDAQALERFTSSILQAAGATETVAARVARHLVSANLIGVDSHGVMRLPHYVSWLKDGRVSTEDSVEVLRERGVTALLDAHFTYGPVAASRAVEIALEKAREFCVSAVSIKNCTHTGRLGEYVEDLAKEGFIGFACCNAQGAGQFVAPWGGKEPRLSTNPIAWGFPASTEDDPDGVLVMDMATSASAEGGVRIARERGRPIPLGHVIDSQGRDTTNPVDLFGPPPGAILTMGQHKGYGLALVVEILSGAVSGGGCVRPTDELYTHENAFFLMAIDPEGFRPLDEIRSDITAMLGYVKTSGPRDPRSDVLLPYEKERATRKQRLQEGIPIEVPIWEELTQLAASFGVPQIP